jgi:phosphoribosylcarboxyaminoimidazole (NCAIR) mutase
MWVCGWDSTLNGQDSLLSIVQMPRGIPVGTLAIGDSGAANAAILAASILAAHVCLSLPRRLHSLHSGW